MIMSHDNVLDHIPLIDSIDAHIVMHCLVHFSGNFNEMVEYYEQKGVGRVEGFTVKRIKQIQQVEGDAIALLPVEAVEAVEQARELYLDLRQLYENDKTPAISLLIADLILTEREYPKEEINALVALKKDAVAPLCDLLSSPTFYDPLHPGYGRTPVFAAKALGMIKDPSSLSILLNALGNDHFAVDEAIIDAICSFGPLAKEFLLKKLSKMPYSKDNERAAIVLSAFPEDKDIAESCLKLLIDDAVRKNLSFAPYLVFPCQVLQSPADRELFKALATEKTTPEFIRNEMEIVIKRWKC